MQIADWRGCATCRRIMVMGSDLHKSKACSACKSIYYCSSVCQKTGWKSHQREYQEKGIMQSMCDKEQKESAGKEKKNVIFSSRSVVARIRLICHLCDNPGYRKMCIRSIDGDRADCAR